MLDNHSYLFILFFFIALINPNCYAQQNPQDTISPTISVQDSSSKTTAKTNPKRGGKKNPKKSKQKASYERNAIFLGIIPGGGQIYNRKYWKLPLVYGGLGGLGYFMIDSGRKFRCYKRAYREMIDTDSTTNFHCQFDTDSLGSSELRILRDRFQNNFEIGIIAFSAFYVLTIVDAFVDAHLRDFDISDDLSMSVRPRLQVHPIRGHLTPSLRLSFRPKHNTSNPPFRF